MTRKPEAAAEGPAGVESSLQAIINDIEAGWERDALLRAVDLLRDLKEDPSARDVGLLPRC